MALRAGQDTVTIMVQASALQLQYDLERHVSARTGRRIRNLTIELGPELVVLRGRTSSYYVKQLAQHGVRELLPEVSLENSIVVDASISTPPSNSAN